MPEPFKNAFNPDMIRLMAKHLSRSSSDFDKRKFIKIAINELDSLELKERSNQICSALEASMPQEFSVAGDILLSALHPDKDTGFALDMDNHGVRGWATMPIGDYIACRGLKDFDLSMNMLKEVTMRGSSEFAIRTFLLADPDRAIKHFMDWAYDANYHVRRLVSEGSRPRLPWGQRLPMFVENPAPIIELLEILKDDTEEYVRRSVANNLNDIAKDHPDTVAKVITQWIKDASPQRRKLVRHGCRSLIKQGHKPTLLALGYKAPRVSMKCLLVNTPKLHLGEYLQFHIELESNSNKDQALIIDYVIHHRKANGETSPKVFKWKDFKLNGRKSLTLEKKHPIRPITTRTYYSGLHHVEIQINGKSFGQQDFHLMI